MKPFIHSKNSANKYGGKPEDYIDIHNFIDSSKATLADVRHRALLHSTFGCFLVEKMFGVTITNSEGKQISTRDIAEDHVVEDLGFIPTTEHWLKNMKIEDWMGGTRRGSDRRKPIHIKID